MTAKDFVEAFESAAAKLWNGPVSPTQLVEIYEKFTDSVEGGYDWCLGEYDNDIYVRDVLARLLEDPAILVHSEFAWVIDAVDDLDRRLRAMLTTGLLGDPPQKTLGGGLICLRSLALN